MEDNPKVESAGELDSISEVRFGLKGVVWGFFKNDCMEMSRVKRLGTWSDVFSSSLSFMELFSSFPPAPRSKKMTENL